MSLETPIRDIVDRCRVWESHADSDNQRFSKPGPDRALPIYTVNESGCGTDDRIVAAVTTSQTGSVGDFAQTAASRSGGAATTSQANAFAFGTVVTAFVGGGSEACSAGEDCKF